MAATLNFSSYLIPSLPVWRSRRRVATSSADLSHEGQDFEFNRDTDNSTEDDQSGSNVPRIVTRSRLGKGEGAQSPFSNHDSYLVCQGCQTQLCFTSAIVSKGFTGRHGRAYLTSHLLGSNINHQKPTIRTLQTGSHTVSDVTCAVCNTTLGWKYLAAEDRTQRYKVGKYILETGKVIKVNWWEGCKKAEQDEKYVVVKEVEVDVDDEDEMEELFLGCWDKDKVAKRREKRKPELGAT